MADALIECRIAIIAALTDALPLHDQDGRIDELAECIEDMIDVKLERLEDRLQRNSFK